MPPAPPSISTLYYISQDTIEFFIVNINHKLYNVQSFNANDITLRFLQPNQGRLTALDNCACLKCHKTASLHFQNIKI